MKKEIKVEGGRFELPAIMPYVSRVVELSCERQGRVDRKRLAEKRAC